MRVGDSNEEGIWDQRNPGLVKKSWQWVQYWVQKDIWIECAENVTLAVLPVTARGISPDGTTIL